MSNALLAEGERLTDVTLQGGDEAPAAFRELIQLLLKLTVLGTGQSVRLHGTKSSDNFIIAGHKRRDFAEAQGNQAVYAPLQLKNGAYLYLFYDAFIDRTDRKFLKIKTSNLMY